MAKKTMKNRMRKTKRPIKNKKMTGRKGGYVKQRTIRGGLTISGVHMPGTGRFLESSKDNTSRYGVRVQGVFYQPNPTNVSTDLNIIRTNITIPSTEEYKLLKEFENKDTLNSIIQKIGYYTPTTDAVLELMQSALTDNDCMSCFIYLYVKSKHLYGNTTSLGLGETKKSGGFFTNSSRIRLFVVKTVRWCVNKKIIVSGPIGPEIDHSQWQILPKEDVGRRIVFNGTALATLTMLGELQTRDGRVNRVIFPLNVKKEAEYTINNDGSTYTTSDKKDTALKTEMAAIVAQREKAATVYQTVKGEAETNISNNGYIYKTHEKRHIDVYNEIAAIVAQRTAAAAADQHKFQKSAGVTLEY